MDGSCLGVRGRSLSLQPSSRSWRTRCTPTAVGSGSRSRRRLRDLGADGRADGLGPCGPAKPHDGYGRRPRQRRTAITERNSVVTLCCPTGLRSSGGEHRDRFLRTPHSQGRHGRRPRRISVCRWCRARWSTAVRLRWHPLYRRQRTGRRRAAGHPIVHPPPLGRATGRAARRVAVHRRSGLGSTPAARLAALACTVRVASRRGLGQEFVDVSLSQWQARGAPLGSSDC